MSWSAEFKATLAGGRLEPRYLLEWVQVPHGATRVFGGNVRLSSFPVQGYENIINTDGSSFSGGTLSLRDWSCQPLSFSIGILGDGERDIRVVAQRGQVVVLKVGFSNDPATFEPVALGTIYGLSRQGSGWVLRCKGLEGSFGSRITIEAGEQSIGHDLASTTVNDTGGVGSGEADITLTDASNFRTDGQGVGVVQFTADNGSTYLSTYTGVTSNTLNGCTHGVMGTTWSATADGNAVAEVMYTSAHPVDILARIITSTGLGSNGPHDILPASWGLGIPYEHLNDRDINTFKNLTQPTSGSAAQHWVQAAEIENPQSAMASWANTMGYFLTQHQGQITARGALLPWDNHSPNHYSLTDGMIERIGGYDAWDPDSPIEYSRCRILYSDGNTQGTSAASDLDHIPARDIKAHTSATWSTSTNALAINTELLTRLKQWDQRTAEVITLTLHGWWPGLASPGSTLDVDLTVLTSRTGHTFRGQGGLLTRCAVNWFGSTTDVEIAVLPADEVVPWRT